MQGGELMVADRYWHQRKIFKVKKNNNNPDEKKLDSEGTKR
jgi:hypothetical protein